MVERRMFLIALLTFSYETIFIILSFFFPTILIDREHTRVLLNYFWIGDCGIFALVTVIVSKRLRRKMIALVCSRGQIGASSTVRVAMFTIPNGQKLMIN
ncbi:hypothetical protein L596_021799 [Steinernema carpocapsae]|nr:hypothetical protein L596_021799 [Steinernema carpocapsae]